MVAKPIPPPRPDWPTFDSIGAAAGATGIPEKVLKRAKRDGCPAFKSNRVYFGDFLAWYFTREHQHDPSERLLIAKTLTAEEKAKQEAINTQKLSETVVAKTLAKQVITRYGVGLRGKLLDVPKRMALTLSLLKEPIDIETKLAEEIRGILAQMFRTEWGECKCPNCGKEIK